MTSRHSTIPRTTCLIFNDQGQILLLKFSPEKGKLAGYYDPPGGHIEASEGIIENAEREIHEETNLKVRNTKLRGVIHVTNFFNQNLMLFVTASLARTTKAKPSREGTPQWVNLKDLDSLKIFPDLKTIITRVSNPQDSSIFTATSRFDDHGKLINFTFE